MAHFLKTELFSQLWTYSVVLAIPIKHYNTYISLCCHLFKPSFLSHYRASRGQCVLQVLSLSFLGGQVWSSCLTVSLLNFHLDSSGALAVFPWHARSRRLPCFNCCTPSDTWPVTCCCHNSATHRGFQCMQLRPLVISFDRFLLLLFAGAD